MKSSSRTIKIRGIFVSEEGIGVLALLIGAILVIGVRIGAGTILV